MSDLLSNVRIEYINEVTVNTGNFQNVKPGYRVAVDVPDGMHPNLVRDKLKSLVDGWLEADVTAIQREMKQ